MPASFRPSLFAFCALLAVTCSVSHAQQPAPTGLAPTLAAPTAAAPAPASSAGLTSPTDAAQQLIASSMKKMNANDIDGALSDLTQALRSNPNSTGAYVLRASLYTQKKQWALAEADFKAAQKIAPNNPVLKFNLVEIKFMQKQYDLARPGFAAIESDPDMGDFASYKVYLCDLLAGHLDVAKKELDVFNAAMGNPSYYFGNAAWDLIVSKNVNDARSWLLSASRIYPPRKNMYYAQSLRDLGYLPIPAPGDVVRPPAPAGTAAATP